MDFELTEEQQMIQEMAWDFASTMIAPKAAAMDEAEELDLDILKEAAKLGFMGVTISEEYGGTGLTDMELVLILEQINRVCASTGVTLSVHNSLFTSPVKRYGAEEQKQQFLPRIATGERIGAYCLTEANAGSDAANQQTMAVQEGDEWVLNGTKLFVTNGAIAADYIVFARTSREGKPHQGVSTFIIPREAPGFSIGAIEHKLGIRASSTTEIVLEDCRIPAGNLLGEENKGFYIAMDTLNNGRIGIAAQSLGLTQAALDAANEHAKQRTQFGKPLMAQQAIQFKLANIAMDLEAARLLTYKAAIKRSMDTLKPEEGASAKLFASRLANRATFEAVQVFGGYGFSREFPVERYYRDARITEIYEGTSEVQQMVIAKSLM